MEFAYSVATHGITELKNDGCLHIGWCITNGLNHLPTEENNWFHGTDSTLFLVSSSVLSHYWSVNKLSPLQHFLKKLAIFLFTSKIASVDADLFWASLGLAWSQPPMAKICIIISGQTLSIPATLTRTIWLHIIFPWVNTSGTHQKLFSSLVFFFFFGLSSWIRQGLKYKEKKRMKSIKLCWPGPDKTSPFFRAGFCYDQGNTKNRYWVSFIIKNLGLFVDVDHSVCH